MATGESINQVLADHQKQADGWAFKALASDLHTWAERMVLEFKLEIGTPALMVDAIARRRYGHYRHGRNGFGLADEVALNARHLCRAYWQVLGTLLHELLHAWQEHHGKPGKRNYHNRQFREKSKVYGLTIDDKGHTQYEPAPTPFTELLRKHGVEVPEMPKPVIEKIRGKSKLALYLCPCGVKVRIGRSEFRARCLDCDGDFEMQK